MLTVYRASAGAGKTHKLTGEYLKLLFASPGAYRRILAVTFTNKATDEMKGRIVQELYTLSSGQKSDYVPVLSSRFGLDEAQVRAQARKVLIAILHDYSAFNISTIDRFFQQTMRAFTREIGLQGGYAIEMDQELVLTEAIDNLLAGLKSPKIKNYWAGCFALPLIRWKRAAAGTCGKTLRLFRARCLRRVTRLSVPMWLKISKIKRRWNPTRIICLPLSAPSRPKPAIWAGRDRQCWINTDCNRPILKAAAGRR